MPRVCISETPAEVEIHFEPRPPERDPTLGVAVEVDRTTTTTHRLVVVGDSISEGFMSGAIFRTDLSWPATVAYELGLRGQQFRYPTYEPPDGPGGIPLDLERLARALGDRVGDTLSWTDVLRNLRWLRRYMDRIEDYWERGPGSVLPPGGPPPFHNGAVYGWDLLDAVALDADVLEARIAAKSPRDDLIDQLVENDNDRAGLVVLQHARDAEGSAGTMLDAAAALGEDGGIETLVVMLGANNALGTVVHLRVCWSSDDYLTLSDAERFEAKRSFTVWRPAHFADEWARVVTAVRAVRARHVIVSTVPAVTIAPLAHGLGGKIRPGSRYFPYYTRPWIPEEDFDPRRDANFTAEQARAIDSAIDAYNATIIDSVRRAREDGLDWLLFDLGGLLDSLATRRYELDPAARPAWWEPYELPPELAELRPVPNTRFFVSGPDGREDGGLFALDGVHPTTSGYGVIAREVVRLMDAAGVHFTRPDGTDRPSPVEVDFERILATDTLLSDPPTTVASSLAFLAWLDQVTDWARRIVPFGG